jgi:hypothetical protein
MRACTLNRLMTSAISTRRVSIREGTAASSIFLAANRPTDVAKLLMDLLRAAEDTPRNHHGRLDGHGLRGISCPPAFLGFPLSIYHFGEFTFRFNRRTSASRGKLFYRLLQHAVQIEPVPYKRLVGSSPEDPHTLPGRIPGGVN